MSEAPFYLLTSLRHDVELESLFTGDSRHIGWNYNHKSPLYMLDFHRDRLLRAAEHWGWNEAVEKLSGDEALHELARMAQDAAVDTTTKPQRLRILVNSQGTLTFQKFDTPSQPLENLYPRLLTPPSLTAGPDEHPPPPCFDLVVDDSATPRSEFTHFKTTWRAVYDAARRRAGIRPGDLKEVLILNADERSVMEGSITTPYFWRRDRWVTPPVSPRFSLDKGSGGHDGTSRRWALDRGLAVEEAVLVDSLSDGEECWISNGVSGFQRAVLHK
ncbi:hypothetical protein L249_6317 [Ophiocordyceps polyrhachis-furcata BCC 54312]|uniref:Aminodeoxychorismate lyase n=1 Tax=Ophiocordyceps polyrhachis-furcata BCC 54312 TaxID=1330021 RepID=A0A367L114_9HYPO|nr:hypothetical protein L249_6317 [Ophiocordyceps polyrhachis-furcata BCC 54312]